MYILLLICSVLLVMYVVFGDVRKVIVDVILWGFFSWFVGICVSVVVCCLLFSVFVILVLIKFGVIVLMVILCDVILCVIDLVKLIMFVFVVV